MSASPVAVKEPFRKQVLCWLLLCIALVAFMVVVGGYTRLSGSGLSITEWKPVHGVIPPLDELQWREEFAAYQKTPQYAHVNSGMTLEEFKTIFWPEYWHRVLGRAIGLVFFAPLVYFALRRAFGLGFGLRLLGIFALGGLQGVVGWYMVKSGLVNDPHVSHFRLTAHLCLAFAIIGLLLWTVLDLRHRAPSPALSSGRQRMLSLIFLLLCAQIAYGAMAAGLHAGLIYNTFPDFNGKWRPDDLWAMSPAWLNPLENVATVQFIHRWLAKILLVAYFLWWRSARKEAISKSLARLMLGTMAVLILQFLLGISTLLAQVPLHLALAHQSGGLVLFLLMTATLHDTRKSG